MGTIVYSISVYAYYYKIEWSSHHSIVKRGVRGAATTFFRQVNAFAVRTQNLSSKNLVNRSEI